jgi:cell wall-associated NlpC family hydrolase
MKAMKILPILALTLLAACSSTNKYAKYIDTRPAVVNANSVDKQQYTQKFEDAVNFEQTINVGSYDLQQASAEEETFISPDEFFGTLVSEIEYTDKQRQIIDTGLSYLGIPYVFGGSSPEKGFDCSGFTQYVFKNAAGTNLPRTAKQMAQVGTPVDEQDLKAGDLVFFNTRGFAYSHVGVYIGDGKFFHASPSFNQITIGDLYSKYFATRFNGGRRVMG